MAFVPHTGIRAFLPCVDEAENGTSKMIQITKLYLTWQRPLYKKSAGVERHFDIPQNAIVYAADQHIEQGRQLVDYKGQAGWIETEYLEPYIEALPKDCVDMSGLQTSDEYDAQQYIVVGKKRVVNACGMISIAYLTGKPLLEVIETWKAEYPNHYRIIDNGNWLTSSDDLITILSALGVEAEKIRLKRYTPSRITGREIVAVIMNFVGRLHTTGMRHWVVPVSVQPERQGYGTIDLFNPYPNRIERYSWNEFVTSAAIVSGVVR